MRFTCSQLVFEVLKVLSFIRMVGGHRPESILFCRVLGSVVRELALSNTQAVFLKYQFPVPIFNGDRHGEG